MFRPAQLPFGNSAGGKFCKGHSKAQKQITAVSRPAERLSQLSKQQLAVDADGTVSHSAVVPFLTGPVQMMLVNEAVQHSLGFGQQLAGDKVTLPCRPRDWIVVHIPSTMTETDTSSRKMKNKAAVKQSTAVRQASSTTTSSPVNSSYDAKGTDSSTLSQPRFDAPVMVTTTLPATEAQEASVGDSSPDTTTIISGPSPSFLADVPLSPATSFEPLSAVEEANSSTLCEDSLACTSEEDTKWTTSTWTYQDVFKVSDSPMQSSLASGPSASKGTFPETESSFATDITKSNNCNKDIGSAHASVEVSLHPKHLTTKPLLSSSTTTAKLTQVLQEPPRPDSTTPSDDRHKLCAESDPVACTRPIEEFNAAAECISHCTTDGRQLNTLQRFCSTVKALLGQARWLMGASTTTAAAPCCHV